MATGNSENAGTAGSPQPGAPVRKRRSWFSTILLTIAAIIGVFLILVALQPADFTIMRTTSVLAPPETVFAQVNDFHKWEAWSPWAKLDPAMKQTFEGPPSGKGASYSWVGNSEVGEGRMTIIESHSFDLVKIKLEFLKPFAATNTTDFTFKSDGKQTDVTWSMTGKNNFVGKAMGLLMNMDKMVGGQFEQGLEKMKNISEKEAKTEVAK